MVEILDLYRDAEALGITVDEFELSTRDAASLMDEDGDCFIALDPRKLRTYADERVELTHETGHCVTGAFYNEYSPFDIRQKHENRADRYAIRRLVPEEELYRALRDGRTEVWELAEYFGVTEPFMKKALRYYMTGSLTS